MSTPHWIDRLSDYRDGHLSPADRAACDAHLTACAECATALAEVEELVTVAVSDPNTYPAQDLWPAVLQQIQSPTAAGGTATVVPLRPRPRQITLTLPQLALAASLLMAVSAGVAYVAAGRVTTPAAPATLEAPIQAQAEPVPAPSIDARQANFADAQFDQAVADLERILIDQRDELDPRTVMVIERNLTVIDEAIRQARAALDADPANPFLNSHLADARRKKLELLRRAATLSAPSGD